MIDRDLYIRWFHYLISTWRLDPRLARYVAAAQALIQQHGGKSVPIISGYRSPEKQLKLQARWDAGDRAGLIARPATYSWHMQGLAIDVNTRARAFNAFKYLMLYWGLEWGGNFKVPDRVHFQLAIGERKSIQQLMVT